MRSVLPPLSQFPPAREHPMKDEIIAENNRYIAEVFPFKTQAERDLTIIESTSLAIPDGQLERMKLITRFNVLYLATDELFESSATEKKSLMHQIENIMKGHNKELDVSPLGRIVSDLYQNLAATCTAAEYSQHVRATVDFFRCQDPVRHTEISAFLEFRRLNGGGYLFFGFARYALGAYLTDEQLEHPLLKEVREARGTSSVVNLVTMILEYGVDENRFETATEAQAFVRTLIKSYEKMLHGALSEAMADEELQKSTNAQRWLVGMTYVVSGNLWWSQQTLRYNLPTAPGPRKVIHIEGVGDVIEPGPVSI
ncbi:isoprenoid synthase domain-containing protein [Mycena capillaripes]|nr:isoprenoid synthase domain-containing protein [Mycena capillaripes]